MAQLDIVKLLYPRRFVSSSTIGVCHGDDLQYLFEPSVITDSLEGSDALVLDRMATAWTNFAKLGTWMWIQCF